MRHGRCSVCSVACWSIPFFRQYDSVRYVLRDGWKGIEKILDEHERQERLLKNFPETK